MIKRNLFAKLFSAVLIAMLFVSGPATGNMAYPTSVHSHWKMDGAIDTDEPNAKTTTGYNLTEVGSVPSLAGKLDGTRGGYLATQYFLWPASGSAATVYDGDHIAWEGWYRVVKNANIQTILCKGRRGVNGMVIYLDANGYLNVQSEGINVLTHDVDTGTVGNVWHYFFWAVNTDARLYVDGVSVDAQVGTAWTSVASDLEVGYDSQSANSAWSGDIDDLACHDDISALTWTEIEEQIITPRYNAGAGERYGTATGYDFKQKNFSDKNIKAKGL